MTLESKVLKYNVMGTNQEWFKEADVRLAVGELKELLRNKAFNSLTDDIYTPESIDDAFLYLPEIYKAIDEVLGFTTKGADKK
jgi:hypothetical protein